MIRMRDIRDALSSTESSESVESSKGRSARMIEYKLLTQRVGLVGLVNLFASLSGIILMPVLTKNLSLEDYGIWAQINVTLGLVSAVVLMGLTESLTRFGASARNIPEIRERFYSIFLMIMSIGITFSFLVLLFSRSLAEALFGGNITVVRIIAAMLLIDSLNSIIFYYFRTVQQMKMYSFFAFLNTYLGVAIVSILVLLDQGIFGAAIGLMSSKLMIFIITFALIFHELGFEIPRFKDARAYLAFGLPLVPSSLSSWVINSSDRYVIGLLMGPEAVGIYSPGYLLGNIVMMFMGPISIVLPVAIFKHFDNRRIDIVKVLLSRSLKYYLALAIPAAFGLTFLSRSILLILSTTQIADDGYIITPFVALSMLVFGAISIVSNIMALEKKMTILCAIWALAALLNLCLTFLLVSCMGIIGAAIATLASFIFILILVTFSSRRYLRLNLDYHFIAKSIIASLSMYLVIYIISPMNIFELLATITISACIYIFLLFLLKGVDMDEIRFIREVLRGAVD